VFSNTRKCGNGFWKSGRSKDLRGVAAAIVKLWEKIEVAKVAVKRGVLNTNNERIAIELKVKTLVSV
jgi:hypothetical protein